MNSQEAAEYIFSEYNWQKSKMEDLKLKPEEVAAIIRATEEIKEIKAAGIFGSASDESRDYDEDSDIDLGIYVSNIDKERIMDISFQINRRVEKILQKEVEIDVISLNQEISQPNTNDNFRETVSEQLVMIKGNQDTLNTED